jgi:hypothetical protein
MCHKPGDFLMLTLNTYATVAQEAGSSSTLETRSGQPDNGDDGASTLLLYWPEPSPVKEA